MLLTVSFWSKAQLNEDKYFTKNFNIQSGLSQAVVTDIIQDKTGFIWISTYDGLNRFDGFNFTVFQYIPNDSTSLPTPKVRNLFYDNNKHLWLLTHIGWRVFNLEKGQMESAKKLYDLNLQGLCNDDKNTVWGFGEDNKLYAIDKNKLSIKSSSIPNDFITPLEEIMKMECTQDYIFLMSKLGHIYSYHKRLKKWSKHYNFVSKKDEEYRTSVFDNKKTIYMGSMHSDLLEFDIESKEFSFSPANNMQTTLLGINDLAFDEDANALFISTYGQGVFYYDINKKQTFQYKHGEGKLKLAANYPLAILLGKHGSIWIGYDGRGMDVLDPNIKKFTPIKHVSPEDAFNLQFVRKIVEDDQGAIWFATAGSGLVEYHRDTKKFTFHNTGFLTPRAETFIIEMAKVNNQIWLGLNGGGVAIFDIEKKKVIKVLKRCEGSNCITSNTVWSFYFDKKRGHVWVGTPDRGLSRIDVKSFETKQYYSENNPLLKSNGIRVISTNTQGELLVGTTDGLLKLNRRADIFERVYPARGSELNNLHSLKCIYEDYQGRYWLGTDGSGIAVLDSEYKLIKTFSTKNNLSNNVIYGILPQNDSSLWVSSNKGLSNIIFSESVFTNNENIKVYNYNAQSGLQGNEFNTGSYAKLSDGSLAFGGLDGANIFKGEEVLPNKITSDVVITDFAVFNKEINNQLLTPYLDEIDLAYNQNSISLNYSTVELTLPEKVMYRYRLKGHDKEWVDAKFRTYVSYTNLDPGQYEFQVMASNYDGYWGTKYTTLKINIASPIYTRWWFLLSIGILLVLIIYALWRYRLQQRNEKESMTIEYTKELAEVEMKALRAQINPHFLFNSLNSINNFILKNDNVNARKYLVKFSQLVRNILNNSTAPYVSLKEELDTISLYIQIESMRFDNQFNYYVRLDEELNASQINIPSLLLQPYIENAIWHGLLHKEGRKNIEIRITRKSPDLISIEIEDNGIGRKSAEFLTSKESRRKSYGMQLGENRLKLMNSENQSRGDVEVIDLYDENGKGRGTLIAITLPIIERKIKQTELNNN